MKKGVLQRELDRYKSKGWYIIPSFTIYILFFFLSPKIGQLIWPSVLSITDNKLKLYLIVQLGWNFVWFLCLMAMMTTIYYIQHPFFEQYKIIEKDWPWKTNKKDEWYKLLRKTIAVVLFNNVFLASFVAISFLWLNNWQVGPSMEIEKLPDMSTFTFQIIFSQLCFDFFFHFAHWLLHTKWLYNHVHKIHHQHTMTIGPAAEYAHPVEFILGNIIPVSMGGIILGKQIHFFTLIMWGMWMVAATIDAHSGYEFPWNPYRCLPMASSATYHDFHHSKNVGNFSGAFTYLDYIFGTQDAYWEYIDKKNIKEKHA